MCIICGLRVSNMVLIAQMISNWTGRKLFVSPRRGLPVYIRQICSYHFCSVVTRHTLPIVLSLNTLICSTNSHEYISTHWYGWWSIFLLAFSMIISVTRLHLPQQAVHGAANIFPSGAFNHKIWRKFDLSVFSYNVSTSHACLQKRRWYLEEWRGRGSVVFSRREYFLHPLEKWHLGRVVSVPLP